MKLSITLWKSSINFEFLMQQKAALISLLSSQPYHHPELEGTINLIDHIQDSFVAAGVEEAEVFEEVIDGVHQEE